MSLTSYQTALPQLCLWNENDDASHGSASLSHQGRAYVALSNQLDHAGVPDKAILLGLCQLAASEVCHLASYGRVTLGQRIKDGKMPQPVDRGEEHLFDRAAGLPGPWHGTAIQQG